MKTSCLEVRHFSSIINNKYGTWFVEKDFNGLFFLPVDRNLAEFVGVFENELLFGRNLFENIIEVGDRLFFIPSSGKNIHIYDMKKKGFSKISVLNLNNKRYLTAGLHSSFLYGKYIYFFQCCDSSLLRLNTMSNEIEEINLYHKKVLNEYSLYWNRRIFLNGDVVMMYSIKNNEFVYYDLSREAILHKRLIKGYTFSDYFVIEDFTYCIDEDGNIVKLDENNGITHLGTIKKGKYLFNQIKTELWIYDVELQQYIKRIKQDEFFDIEDSAIDDVSGDVINQNNGFVIQHASGEYWCDGLVKNKPILSNVFRFPRGVCFKDEVVHECSKDQLKQFIQLVMKMDIE